MLNIFRSTKTTKFQIDGTTSARVASSLQNFLDYCSSDYNDAALFLKDFVLEIEPNGSISYVHRKNFKPKSNIIWVPMDCIRCIGRLQFYCSELNQFGHFVSPLFDAVTEEIMLHVKTQAS